MSILIQYIGDIELHNQSSAYDGLTSAGRGSLGIRSDAGNVGFFQNTDGAFNWVQFLTSGGGIYSFDAAMTWLLVDNSATAWVIGATGASTMLTFDTTNGAETLKAGCILTTSDGVSGSVRRVGGAVSRVSAESAAVSNAETVFAGSAITLAAGDFKANTVFNFRALFRVSAISGGGATARIRLRAGATTAGTVIFDTGGRAVADEDLLVLQGTLVCRSTGVGGTLTGYCTYQFGPADTSPPSFNSMDVAGSIAGTWTVAYDTTGTGPLGFVFTGQTDAVGTTLQEEMQLATLVG